MFDHCQVKKSIGTTDFQFDTSAIETKASTADTMVKKGQSALILNYLLECKVKKAAHDVEKGKAVSSDT